MKQSRNIALILAGGTGRRMHAVMPKQFMEIDGETVVLHTMRAFQQHPLIHEIYLVCMPEWNDFVRGEAEKGGISKLSGIVAAGESSYASACLGIAHLSENITDPDAIVLVHDVARPLITQDIISRNIAVCLTHGNAITALQSHEAYLVTSDGSSAHGVMPREGLMRAQTPHTFPLATLQQMVQLAQERGIKESQSIFTLAGELGILPLHIAQGDLRNFKITEQSDILIYRALKSLED
ncbi:MAG: 2-C-methyl-D-erythritol 4-phosphate cytidylyltransferase [Bacteroidaceae bacterium]|nr:2-C-methyl-D-erythritol 4-phosphate cytidylyltransferase [Bacteroidaceae bacterium]